MKKPALSDDVLTYFREQGARGGTAASQAMTAAQRTARATKAGQASALARSKKKQQRAKEAKD